jgi:hypothetical protein
MEEEKKKLELKSSKEFFLAKKYWESCVDKLNNTIYELNL